MTYTDPRPGSLEEAIIERWSAGGPAQAGPLTQAQAATVASYEAYIEECESEYRAQERAGGLRLCPSCGRRSLVAQTVATYGGGLPGSEYSELYTCEHASCGYRSL